MTRLKQLIGILILVGFIISGCSGNAKSDWETSPTFTNDNMTLHGVQGKFGIEKLMEKTMNLNFQLMKAGIIRFTFWKKTLKVKVIK